MLLYPISTSINNDISNRVANDIGALHIRLHVLQLHQVTSNILPLIDKQ